MPDKSGLEVLAYAGIGSGIGAIAAAIISTRSQRGQARADAANLLTEAAERVSRLNTRLDAENHQLRRLLNNVIDVADRYLDGAVTRDELAATTLHIREEGWSR